MATMDPLLGDIPGGEILISDGTIEAVGRHVDAGADVEVVDLAGHIVLPGFIDTHWHLWNTILRGIVGSGEGRAYFPVKRRLAPLFRPEDSYAAARLALTEATQAGITTSVNWNHNLRSPDDADANIRAHLESGLRCRLAYGNPDAFDPTQAMDMDDVDRLRSWLGDNGDQRLDLGVALRGPTRTEPEIMEAEWTFARERGLPITMHMGGRREDVNRYADITSMYEGGFLGSDVQLVHAVDASGPELDLLAETDTSLTLSPVTEFKSMAFPPLADALDRGIRVSLSIDTLAAPTNADMTGVMKLMLRMEQYRDRSSTLDERRIVELATIDGARDLGLEGITGSLTPGKRADVVAVDGGGPAMAPGLDPLSLVVHCSQPGDITLVVADGRTLKRDGQLTAVDRDSVINEANKATSGLLERADWDITPQLGRI